MTFARVEILNGIEDCRDALRHRKYSLTFHGTADLEMIHFFIIAIIYAKEES